MLACGLLLAFFACRTFVDPLPRQHRLDFGPARWIENAEPSASGYFRKIIYISGNIDRAWVQVSATDRFFLYVNGVPVDENFFSNTRVSGIYDIKHLLTSGRNVIAIRSRRISYPGNCQILVRGFYSTESSPLTGFQSDSTWKVSTTPDGVVGSQKWNDTVLDDALWANAHEAAHTERFSTILPVDTDPLLFETRPSAALSFLEQILVLVCLP